MPISGCWCILDVSTTMSADGKWGIWLIYVVRVVSAFEAVSGAGVTLSANVTRCLCGV